MLQCPGYKCHECLNDKWALVLFGAHETDKDLVTKFKDNNVRRIVDRHTSLVWCPVSDCGSIVILPKDISPNENSGMDFDLKYILQYNDLMF